MNGKDIANVFGTIVDWYGTALITSWDFVNAHGWYVATAGVGIILVGSGALILAKRRRARVPAQRTPVEDRERAS